MSLLKIDYFDEEFKRILNGENNEEVKSWVDYLMKNQGSVVSYVSEIIKVNSFSEELSELLWGAVIVLLAVIKKVKGEIPIIEVDDLVKNETQIIEDINELQNNASDMEEKEKETRILGNSGEKDAVVFYLDLFLNPEYKDDLNAKDGDMEICFFTMRNLIEIFEKKLNLT